MEKKCPYCGCSENDAPEEPYQINENNRTVTIDGKTRRFPPIQWKIFLKLERSAGNYVNKDVLMNLLYSHRLDPPFESVIPVHICKINSRLRGTRLRIKNHWGGDWKLVCRSNTT